MVFFLNRLFKKNNTRKNFPPTQVRNSETRKRIQLELNPKVNINLQGYYPAKPNPLITGNYVEPNTFTRQQSFFKVAKARKTRKHRSRI